MKLRASIFLLVGAICLALGTTACATFKQIDYVPQPEESERPAEDFIRLTMMAKRWKPTAVEVKQTFATLWYVGTNIPGGETSVTIPFDEIEHIEVGKVRKHVVTRVTDADGQKLYEYVAVDFEKAKEFADAMAAIARADGEIDPAKTDATK